MKERIQGDRGMRGNGHLWNKMPEEVGGKSHERQIEREGWVKIQKD